MKSHRRHVRRRKCLALHLRHCPWQAAVLVSTHLQSPTDSAFSTSLQKVPSPPSHSHFSWNPPDTWHWAPAYGLSSSSYCIWCLAFLNSVIWTAQNHPLTPGMVGTLYSWFRLFTSVRNTMLLFLRIPRHTFQQYPSHTSWHPRKAKEIRASLPLGFCSDRSCRILKLKGYRHPAPMVPAK